MRSLLVFSLAALAFVDAEIFFEERFEDGEKWEKRWVNSEHKSDLGKFVLNVGKFYGDAEKDKGIQTSQHARFYGISAKFDKFSGKGKTTVVQFTVKLQEGLDCAGGYVKLFPSTLKQKDLHGESPYNIMFGPDICGSTKKVHVILNHKGKNRERTEEILCKDDTFTHLYTLILNDDDQTYEVLIDNKSEAKGSIAEDWNVMAPKKIMDPNAKKPSVEEWDDREKIPDPEEKKPEDWDSRPQHIPDPEAKKPEDWDDDMDGDWEPPQIDNPEYKGKWEPKLIDNPNYKGTWVHPEIDNPDYDADAAKGMGAYTDISMIGLDLWQVMSGTIFDNFIITDSVDEAKKMADETWAKTKDPEAAMKKKQDDEAEEKAKEAKEAEEKAKETTEKAKEGSTPEDEKPEEDHDEL